MKETIFRIVDREEKICSDYINLSGKNLVKIDFKELDFTALFLDSKKRVQEEYVKILEKIAQNFKLEYAIDSTLLEKNTNNRSFFKYLLVLYCLKKIKDEREIIAFFVKPNSVFTKIIRNNQKLLEQNLNVTIEYDLKRSILDYRLNLNIFFLRLGKIGLYLIRKILLSVLYNNDLKSRNIKFIDFFWVTSFNSKNLHNVFSPDIHNMISKNYIEEERLNLISCQNLTSLPTICKDKDVIILDAYVKFWDIVYLIKRAYKLSRVSCDYKFCQLNIKDLLHQELINDRFNTNILLYLGFKNLFKKIKKENLGQPLVFYPFENQAFENRICFEARRNELQTVAIQHSIITDDHFKIRKLDFYNEHQVYLDLIVSNSDLFCEELINYNQTRSKIIALKSQRYARFYASSELSDYALNKSSDKILVLFPLIEEGIFSLARELGALKIARSRFIFRFHPYTTEKLRRRIIGLCNNLNVSISTHNSLLEALSDAESVCTTSTSAYLDAIYDGKPVFYLRSKFGSDFVINDDFIRSKLVFGTNVDDLEKFLYSVHGHSNNVSLKETRAYMANKFGSGLSVEEFVEKYG